MTDKQSLGNSIRRHRKDAGMSQVELASLVGPEMRQSWISQYETDVRVPDYKHIHALCKALSLNQRDTRALIGQA